MAFNYCEVGLASNNAFHFLGVLNFSSSPASSTGKWRRGKAYKGTKKARLPLKEVPNSRTKISRELVPIWACRNTGESGYSNLKRMAIGGELGFLAEEWRQLVAPCDSAEREPELGRQQSYWCGPCALSLAQRGGEGRDWSTQETPRAVGIEKVE